MSASSPSRIGIDPARAPRSPISRGQVETALSRSTAVFALIFGLQALPFVVDQSGRMNPAWSIPVVSLMFLAMCAAVVSSIIKRGVYFVNGTVAVFWFFAMATWPLGLPAEGLGFDARPWPWFICTVATSAAALAWPLWGAAVTLIVAPLAYGIVRITPAGGAAGIDLAVYDVIYAMLLGGAALIIITMLRQAAASVDAAQSTALTRYAHAVRQHATEVERVQVDSIVHDSVLTTLLSAARAYTPEARTLSSSMADNAMGYLRAASAASPDDAIMVTVAELAERIRATPDGLMGTFESRSVVPGGAEITANAAEAVYSATVQAMVNSTQHAGTDVERWFAIEGESRGGVVVTVGDSGRGFELESVPPERIGVRVSMIERVANAGGHVEVASVPGRGTIVTIRWPAVAA